MKSGEEDIDWSSLWLSGVREFASQILAGESSVKGNTRLKLHLYILNLYGCRKYSIDNWGVEEETNKIKTRAPPSKAAQWWFTVGVRLCFLLFCGLPSGLPACSFWWHAKQMIPHSRHLKQRELPGTRHFSHTVHNKSNDYKQNLWKINQLRGEKTPQDIHTWGDVAAN